MDARDLVKLCRRPVRALVACIGAAVLLVAADARAQIGHTPGCDFDYGGRGEVRPAFPDIPICAFAGAYQDSSLVRPNRCVGSFRAPLADSVRRQARTITVRFLRDRRVEALPTFGGYRIYRMTNEPDSNRAVLIRRFSKQDFQSLLWKFSSVDTSNGGTTPNFMCRNEIVHDSVVTFIDPDSNQNFVKECRVMINGRCESRGDSVFRLITPPGPHDGFRTWYAVTYELKNSALDGPYDEMFVPDTLDNFARCDSLGRRNTCPNLNHKLANLTATPVEPTAGPAANLERVIVVPNPFRAREQWDQDGLNEVHFINLPSRATIKIYTVAGDLVAQIEHDDTIRDFQRWNLRNQDGRDIASGIYMFRVETPEFSFQDRFVVIR